MQQIQGNLECSCALWSLPGEKSRRSKYCENDSSCSSSGLLGIRKHHKFQKRTVCAKFPAHICRLQSFRCILSWIRKTIRLLGYTLNQTQTPYLRGVSINSGYQECYLIHGVQLFLSCSFALSKKLPLFWQISQSTLHTVLVSKISFWKVSKIYGGNYL